MRRPLPLLLLLLASASLADAQGPPLGEWKVTELTGSITTQHGGRG